jgi:plasmid stabilization system protein ParE
MKVTWSNRALKSLASIHGHIEKDSESAAHQTIDRILKRGDTLAAFPQLGRMVERYNRPNIRELIEPPYRIIYRIQKNEIQIIDVFHSAQLPPWER